MTIKEYKEKKDLEAKQVKELIQEAQDDNDIFLEALDNIPTIIENPDDVFYTFTAKFAEDVDKNTYVFIVNKDESFITVPLPTDKHAEDWLDTFVTYHNISKEQIIYPDRYRNSIKAYLYIGGALLLAGLVYGTMLYIAQ